jgi:hypothetical protein
MSSSIFKADRQELKRLAKLSSDDIGGNENSVKYKFIIPFLKSFGYEDDLDFEHSSQGMRIDILIKSPVHKIPSEHKIVVEAKGPDKNLDDYIISQLKRYCGEKRAILAIITNGEQIRFYSPFWRKPNFNETLIYSIKRRDLSNDDNLGKIEQVLGRQFLEDGSIVEHIEDREREINSIKKRIQALESYYEDKIVDLNDELKSLEEQEKSIQSQINQSKNDVSVLERERRNKIKELEEQNLVHLSKPKLYALPISPGTSQHAIKRRSAEDFVLPTDLPLHKVYKGKKFTAVTVPNNRIRLDLDGNIYTLDEGTLVCIQTVCPRETENAWRWWKCTHPKTGEEVLIDVLRNE